MPWQGKRKRICVFYLLLSTRKHNCSLQIAVLVYFLKILHSISSLIPPKMKNMITEVKGVCDVNACFATVNGLCMLITAFACADLCCICTLAHFSFRFVAFVSLWSFYAHGSISLTTCIGLYFPSVILVVIKTALLYNIVQSYWLLLLRSVTAWTAAWCGCRKIIL